MTRFSQCVLSDISHGEIPPVLAVRIRELSRPALADELLPGTASKWQSNKISQVTFAKVQLIRPCLRGYRIPHDPSTWDLVGVIGVFESNVIRSGEPGVCTREGDDGRQLKGQTAGSTTAQKGHNDIPFLDSSEQMEAGFPSYFSGKGYKLQGPVELSSARFW